MGKLINLKGQIIEDKWQLINDEQATFEYAVISFKRFIKSPDDFKESNLGIALEPGDNPLELEKHLHLFASIFIHFPAFTDGRGYSSAALLRERLNYEGELRATGDVLLDQLFYMQRCGFTHFCLREDQNIEHIEFYLKTFTHHYQSDALKSTLISKHRANMS